MPHVNLTSIDQSFFSKIEHLWAHCRPIKLKVKSAIRIASVDPLIEGVPAHDAA